MPIDFSFDKEQTALIDGFDVIVSPSQYGDAYAFVTLIEETREVFGQDIPIPEQGGDPVQDVGQTAIDMFEAERGTSEQGAGAEVPEVPEGDIMASKKAFVYETKRHEEWFMSFKGTQYEDLAYNMLEDMYALDLEEAGVEDTSGELYTEMTGIEHSLKILNLQRMRELPAGAQVIIIKAFKKHAMFGDLDELQMFIDYFAGSALEPEVLKHVNRYLDIRQELNKRDEAYDAMYETRQELQNQMESLSLESLQRNVVQKIPTEGLGAFPEMAGDMAELMEGVSIDEPSDEMPAFHGMPFETMRASKSAELTVDEVGKTHLGLDPAEVPADKRLPFVRGDKVSISKNYETSTAGGVPLKLSSGTKGVVQTEFDGQGNSVMVHFENGAFLRVPETHLQKSS